MIFIRFRINFKSNFMTILTINEVQHLGVLIIYVILILVKLQFDSSLILIWINCVMKFIWILSLNFFVSYVFTFRPQRLVLLPSSSWLFVLIVSSFHSQRLFTLSPSSWPFALNDLPICPHRLDPSSPSPCSFILNILSLCPHYLDFSPSTSFLFVFIVLSLRLYHPIPQWLLRKKPQKFSEQLKCVLRKNQFHFNGLHPNCNLLSLIHFSSTSSYLVWCHKKPHSDKLHPTTDTKPGKSEK